MIVALSAIGDVIAERNSYRGGILRSPLSVHPNISEIVSVLVGATAGLMIYISANELMPTAQNNRGRPTIFFIRFGIVSVMLFETIG